VEEESDDARLIQQQREKRQQWSLNKINRIKEDLANLDNEFDNDPAGWHHNRFKARNTQRRDRIEAMHKETSDKLAAHEAGTEILSDEELKHHTNKMEMLDRKKQLLEERAEQYGNVRGQDRMMMEKSSTEERKEKERERLTRRLEKMTMKYERMINSGQEEL